MTTTGSATDVASMSASAYLAATKYARPIAPVVRAQRYTCDGSVRGCCGVRHLSLGAAHACCARDMADCVRQGGYSDRSPEESS